MRTLLIIIVSGIGSFMNPVVLAATTAPTATTATTATTTGVCGGGCGVTSPALASVVGGTPAAATASCLELSGAQWVNRFPTSVSTSTLAPTFRSHVDAFISAMTAAGINTSIKATYRPPERAYLMHWSWEIAKNNQDPALVPPMNGVNIEWVHSTLQESIDAAQQMVTGYGINNLGVAPSLTSLHISGEAIDMKLKWTGSVDIKDANGKIVHIDTTPHNGMNKQLIAVGATYGVIKFIGGNKDVPHWSINGH